MQRTRGFETGTLTQAEIGELKERARQSRGDILHMTSLSASGHPGGSMSSIEILTWLYQRMDRNTDSLIVSCGHISPGVYSALGRAGYFDVEEAVATFRLAGSRYTGHVETIVPGIRWDTGNLGQGLSAACALAWTAKQQGTGGRIFCLMGDGEQQKGQLAEARDLAAKLKLDNLVALIDRNRLQISGDTDDVMPQDLAAIYSAHGWNVLEADAHDFQSLQQAAENALTTGGPALIIANSHMGHGVSFMEDQHKYHGSPLKPEQLTAAMEELGLPDRLEEYRTKRAAFKAPAEEHPFHCPDPGINPGMPREYAATEKVALRDAYGKAVVDLAAGNNKDGLKVIGIDCDLAGSTKLSLLQKEYPEAFLQLGIQEHNAAAFAGTLSNNGLAVFYSTFGAFGLCEGYNQQRLNDLNHTRLNLVLTHCGIDVGEDGKTHHAIDYIGIIRNFFHWEGILPADANQMDRAVRYAATRQANVFIGMGRSALPVITNEDGKPAFGDGYAFVYGRDEWLREGADGTIIALGQMTGFALEAWEILRREGIRVGVLCKSCPRTIDQAAMDKALRTPAVFTLEDHNVETGIGAVIAEHCATTEHRPQLHRFGVTDYATSGSAADLYRSFDLDGASVARRVKDALEKRGV